MKYDDEHIEFSEPGPEEHSPKTQPQLQRPGPPRSPSLPSAIATADQDPLHTLLLDESPNLKWTNTRCVFSRLLHRVGVMELSNSVAPRDVIDLKGPFQASAGSVVAISWLGYRSDTVSAWVPEEVVVPEFEHCLLRILRYGKKLAIVPSQVSAGHSIVPAISQDELDA